MEDSELKERLVDLYKSLIEKIISKLGNNINEEDKKFLYSFDITKNLEIDNTSNKALIYNEEIGKLVFSNSFLNTEYIERLKLRNPNASLEVLKNKISDEKMNISLEELIIFCKELNIKEIDVIKSLYASEIMKMILLTDDLSIKEQVIMEGVIELYAHELGIEGGYIVSSPKSNLENLKLAKLLRNEFDTNFEKIIFGGELEKNLNKIDKPELLKMIEELEGDRAILESTQDLDELALTINEMTEGLSQVSVVEINGKHLVKFIDDNDIPTLYETRNRKQFMKTFNNLKEKKLDGEKITKEELESALDLYGSEIPLYRIHKIEDGLNEEENKELAVAKDETKYEDGKMYVNPEEGLYIKEAIVEIKTDEENADLNVEKHENLPFTNGIEEAIQQLDSSKPKIKDIDALSEEEFKELNQRFQKNECTYDEMILMQDYIDNHKDKSKTRTLTTNQKKSGQAMLITIVMVITLTIAAGVTIGWLLFKMQ